MEVKPSMWSGFVGVPLLILSICSLSEQNDINSNHGVAVESTKIYISVRLEDSNKNVGILWNV